MNPIGELFRPIRLAPTESVLIFSAGLALLVSNAVSAVFSAGPLAADLLWSGVGVSLIIGSYTAMPVYLFLIPLLLAAVYVPFVPVIV